MSSASAVLDQGEALAAGDQPADRRGLIDLAAADPVRAANLPRAALANPPLTAASA